MSLQHAFDPRRNSFDFLRFAFAALVLITHSYDLSGASGEPLGVFSNDQENFARMAVNAFFALSGFLIARSRAGAPSTARFLWHRALRILPGFWVCLLVTVVLFAPLIFWIERGTLAGFLSMPGKSLWTYLPLNLTTKINQHEIGDLLLGVPFPGAINGSLWTLYNELRGYAAIALLALFGATNSRRWLFALAFGAFFGLNAFYVAQGGETAATQLPFLTPSFVTHLSFFFGGATLWAYADRVPMRWPIAAGLAVALLISCIASVGYRWFDALAWPYLLLWLATRLPFTRFGAHGDLSYGLYIYGFPVQQILVLLGGARIGVIALTLLSLAVAVVFAVASYRLVEAPALRLKHVGRKTADERRRTADGGRP